MIGSVDGAGRALLPIRLRKPNTDGESRMDAWVDTGFTGELVVPEKMAKAIGLSPGLAVRATLADGSEVVLDTYGCLIDWFGEWKPLELIVNAGQFPLLGTGLLKGHVLHVDYVTNLLTLI